MFSFDINLYLMRYKFEHRNLRSTSNFLIVVESGSLVLLVTSAYLMSLISTGFPPILCFAVYFYVQFINYFTPTLTLIIAVDRYVYVKFVAWYVYLFEYIALMSYVAQCQLMSVK